MRARRSTAAVFFLCLAGCSSPVAVSDPLGTLADPSQNPRRQRGAMEQLDATPDDPAYIKSLEAMMWKSGYIVDIREEAFARLEQHDLDRLKRVIRQRLPRLTSNTLWRQWLCQTIADRDWEDLTPALVSSWSRRIGFVDDLDRAEYKALVQLYGEDHVVDAVFEVLVSSNKAYQQSLRGRCWELLIRLGQFDRLTMLLDDRTVGPDDPMLVDLRACAVELRVIPRTREEILWVRKLRRPEHAAFWSQAASAVGSLPDDRLRELELREIPIIVAASIHDPWLFNADRDELYAKVRAHVRESTQHIDDDKFQGYPGTYGQRLPEHRKDLTWGDLAAMLVAVRAMQVPQVVDHLFDYAERDREDESCEYGGVISLDHLGRFEVLEFPPRFRRHDNEFIASQDMLDAAYTAVFHFHNHAQRHRNGQYAGPGIGDLNYADNLRANCLVFTFINKDTLNVDFYRYDRVIVDLGEIRKQ